MNVSTQAPLTCVTCELGIVGRPEFHTGLPFCCAGCVVGGPCSCSYDVIEDARSIVDAADPLSLEPATGAGSSDRWPVVPGLAGMSRV
jgi:hypothetical protein